MRVLRLLVGLLALGSAPRWAAGAPIVDQWALVPESAPWSSASTAAYQALAQTLLINTTGILSSVGLEIWHLNDTPAAAARGTITVEVRQMRKGNVPSGDLVASGQIVDTGFIPSAGSGGLPPFPVPLTLVDVSSSPYLTTYGERLSIVVRSTGTYAWKRLDASSAALGGDYYRRGNPYSRSNSVWTQGTADFGFATFVEPVSPGDVNLDGTVDLGDFGILKANFGQGARRTGGDLDGDSVVNLTDFGILKTNFGDTTAAVPEPAHHAGWVALVLGSLLVRLRGRGAKGPLECRC
jgi:hypothetical protein